MYVNPFPFGVFLGIIGTFVVEVTAIIIAVLCHKGDKK